MDMSARIFGESRQAIPPSTMNVAMLKLITLEAVFPCLFFVFFKLFHKYRYENIR